MIMSNGEQYKIEDMWRTYGYEPPKSWRPKGLPERGPEKECFGWTKRGCKVLKDDYCLYGECRFYKHHAQYKREILDDGDYVG